MSYIKSFRGQNYLLPPSLTDLFSKDHVCYLIEQLTDDMNYNEFDEKYAGAGHPAYHPRIMIKLLLMASIDGLTSSRRIAKNAQRDAVYIYLSEKTTPRHSAICEFRIDNKKIIKNVLLELNLFAIKEGIIDLSHLMIDGTSIKANANDDKNISKETLKKLERYIENLIEEGIKVDKEEDEKYANRGMHELPVELNNSEKRRGVVRKLVEKINQSMDNGTVEEVKQEVQGIKEYMEENNLKKYSFTDPESRFMLNKKGKIQLSYNAQIVTDRNGLIVSSEVIQDVDDRHQLLPNLARVEQDFGELPEGTKVGADGLYLSPDITKLGKFDLYIPTYGMQANEKDRFSKHNFQYDEKQDQYLCPEGKPVVWTYKSKDQRYGFIEIYTCYDCPSCPHRQECFKSKIDFRRITALPHDKLINQIKEKMLTPEGKAIYKLRQQTVELGFADIKENRNLRAFRTRGIHKVKIEFDLSCVAHNLVKINNILNKRNGGNQGRGEEVLQTSQILHLAS